METVENASALSETVAQDKSTPTNKKSKPSDKNKAKKSEENRGQPKSGRFWKTKKEKFSKIKKSIYKRKFDEKLKLQNDLKNIKEISKGLKEDKKQENILKAQRREENAKRRLENERKSEVVQIIKNTAKIKRMKKKALRKIEKRDLSLLKVV